MMRKQLKVRVVAAAGLLSLVAAPWLTLVAPALAGHDPRHMAAQIEVSYKGFNGEADFELVVEQGQEVELTFVWADTAVPDNAHRILIKGYGVKSQLIDVDRRETTISFVADQPGVFEIVCDWRCEGHKTIAARLNVVGEGGAGESIEGAAVSAVPAGIAVAPAVRPATGEVALGILLTDADGAFLSDATVRFFRTVSFAGVEGEVQIGRAVTDEHGTATFTYRPVTTGEQRIIARFEGAGPNGTAEQAIDINAATAYPAYEQEAKGLQALRRGAPYAGALAVVGIWLTFAYVLVQAASIRRLR